MVETFEDFVKYVEKLVSPYILSEDDLMLLDRVKKFPVEELVVAADIGDREYLLRESDGSIAKNRIETFLMTLKGTVRNRRLAPVDAAKNHVRNVIKRQYVYIDDGRFEKGQKRQEEYLYLHLDSFLDEAIRLLRSRGFDDAFVIYMLDVRFVDLAKRSPNFRDWVNGVKRLL